MGPTWGPPGSCRPQMGLMWAPWTLLSEYVDILRRRPRMKHRTYWPNLSNGWETSLKNRSRIISRRRGMCGKQLHKLFDDNVTMLRAHDKKNVLILMISYWYWYGYWVIQAGGRGWVEVGAPITVKVTCEFAIFSVVLIYWIPDKMAAILQRTFSNYVLSIKIVAFWFKFHWNLFPRFRLTMIQQRLK